MMEQPDIDDELVRVFYEERMVPKLDQLDNLAEVIISGARRKLTGYSETVTSARNDMTLMASILSAAVLIAIGFFCNSHPQARDLHLALGGGLRALKGLKQLFEKSLRHTDSIVTHDELVIAIPLGYRRKLLNGQPNLTAGGGELQGVPN